MSEPNAQLVKAEEKSPITSKEFQVIADQANEKADILLDIVEKAGLSAEINDKPYLFHEAWLYIANFDGVIPILESCKPFSNEKEHGFISEVVLFNKDGHSVGRGIGIATYEEEKQGANLAHQLASKSQTRALAKALRLKYGFLAAMRGMASTPAEEMYIVKDEDEIIVPPGVEITEEVVELEVEEKVLEVKSEAMTENLKKMAFALAGEKKLLDSKEDKIKFAAIVRDHFKVESRSEMVYDQWSSLFSWLQVSNSLEELDQNLATDKYLVKEKNNA